MKKAVTYLFVAFMALLVLYGGVGVSLVTYCCGECQAEGVAVLLDHKCCEIHQHTHSAEAANHISSYSHIAEEDNCCNAEYISFDWNIFNSDLLNLQPIAVALISSAGSQLSPVPTPFMKEIIEVEQESPPGFNPSTYLSLLTILLI